MLAQLVVGWLIHATVSLKVFNRWPWPVRPCPDLAVRAVVSWVSRAASGLAKSDVSPFLFEAWGWYLFVCLMFVMLTVQVWFIFFFFFSNCSRALLAGLAGRPNMGYSLSKCTYEWFSHFNVTVILAGISPLHLFCSINAMQNLE